jgi:hypothetical protein
VKLQERAGPTVADKVVIQHLTGPADDGRKRNLLWQNVNIA